MPDQPLVADLDENDEMIPRYQLPDTMNGLLFCAITDARSLDPSVYTPFSEEWHNALNSGGCEVCLAGSLIAKSFDNPSSSDYAPYMFSLTTMRKLEAVDAMRSGIWHRAFELVYSRRPDHRIQAKLDSLGLPPYSDFYGWGEFHAHLRSLESLIPKLRKIEQEITS